MLDAMGQVGTKLSPTGVPLFLLLEEDSLSQLLLAHVAPYITSGVCM